MFDMYRRPEILTKACEKFLPIMFETAINASKASGNPRVFIRIHKGLDGFMSPEQFKKFYWPTLRELMVALINEGCNPCPLWEGNCTSRLEIINDMPAGKACYAFEATNMVKAKEILCDTVCIRGNVRLSILVTGTPDDVRAYCKKLIDVCGKDGGYIMDSSTGLDDAKPRLKVSQLLTVRIKCQHWPYRCAKFSRNYLFFLVSSESSQKTSIPKKS